MKGIAFAKRNVVMAPKWEVGTDHRGLRTGGATVRWSQGASLCT